MQLTRSPPMVVLAIRTATGFPVPGKLWPSTTYNVAAAAEHSGDTGGHARRGCVGHSHRRRGPPFNQIVRDHT
jgi:hypothetical protein